MTYYRGDLVYLKKQQNWFFVDDDSDGFTLYVSPENRKHQVWALTTTNNVLHRVRPSVKYPCNVMPGPKHL